MAIKKINLTEMQSKVIAYNIDKNRAEKMSVDKNYLDSLCPQIGEKIVFNALNNNMFFKDKKTDKYLTGQIKDLLKREGTNFSVDGELFVVGDEEDLNIAYEKIKEKMRKKRQQENDQIIRYNISLNKIFDKKSQNKLTEPQKPISKAEKDKTLSKIKLKGSIKSKEEIHNYLEDDRKKRKAKEKVIKQKIQEIRRLQKYNQELEKKDKQPQLESPKTLSR